MERIEYTDHHWSFSGEFWERKLTDSLNVEGSAGWRVVYMKIKKFSAPQLGAKVTVYMMRIEE